MKTDLETLIVYEKKIVDLSRRNRLLKYPKKGRSINFSMTLKEFQKKFGLSEELYIEFPHKYVLEEEQATLPDKKIDKDQPPYIPPTKPIGEKLITTLNALRLDTKRKFEEHGLHTLFLTIGRIRWKEPQASRGSSKATDNEFDYDAPVLFIPIKIEEKRNPKKTTIETYLEYNDITVNKVLSLLLEKEYKARSLHFEEEDLQDLPSLISGLLLQAKEIFSELKISHMCTEEIQIGQYSFYGQQIYEDISRNEKPMLGHTFIQALCTHSPITQDNVKVKLDDPDRMLLSDADFNVVDADSSQLTVVSNTLEGSHLNVQGPPGTGKSQTIVNLISNLLARGKSILLVCEKQVALEVVLKRLKDVGLEKLCLPLFYYNADKKIFAKKVIEDRDAVLRTRDGSGVQAKLKAREERIKKLQSYANALGVVAEPLGRTVHWVHGQIAKFQNLNRDILIPWRGEDPLQISHDKFNNAFGVVEEMAPLFNLSVQEKHQHWNKIQREHFSPDFSAQVIKLLSSILSSNVDAENLKIKGSINDWHYILDNKEKIENIRDLENGIDSKRGLFETTEILIKVVNKLEEYTEIENSYPKKVAPYFKNPALEVKNREFFNHSTPIKDAVALFKDLQFIEDGIESLTSSLKRNKKLNNLISFPIERLKNFKDILTKPLLLVKLNNWHQLASLNKIYSSLENLCTLHGQLEESRKLLNDWIIVPSEVNHQKAESIAQNFKSFKYKFFWRHLFPGYYKDIKNISEWCPGKKPSAFEDFSSISLAVDNWFRLQSALRSLIEEFNKNYVQTSSLVGVDELFIYRGLIQEVKNNFIAANTTELDQEIVDAVKELAKDTVALKLIHLIPDTYNFWSKSKSIFAMQELGYESSLLNIQKILPSLRKYLKNIVTDADSIKTLVSAAEYPTELKDLFADMDQTISLGQHIATIQSLGIGDIFPEKDILQKIVKYKEEFKGSVDDIKELHEIVSNLSFVKSNRITIAEGAKLAEEIKNKIKNIEIWLKSYNSLKIDFNQLVNNDIGLSDIEKASRSDAQTILKKMIDDQAGLEKWMRYRTYTRQLDELGHGWFLQDAQGKELASPAAAFALSFYNSWHDKYVSDKPILRSFNSVNQENIVAQFQQLEEEILQLNANRILTEIAPQIRDAKRYGGDADFELIHQSQLKMRHKPIRKLVESAGEQLIKYKPCWMMSPLTLSSYIPYGTLDFDVVVFDEASQMRVEHALGAISRASQVVIFGDEHQLPPTSFFEVNNSEEEEEQEITENYESILHATKEILPGADCMLSNHYRSRYEDLIAFSNNHVYGGRLTTFPNPSNGYRAVNFDYVKDGMFDGGKDGTRQNRIEAKRVVELCGKTIRENPKKSLGVIAFSKSQEVAIRDALLDFLKINPDLQDLLDENSDRTDSFFIKNLESVQGDERDIIIISVGYGRDKNGNIYNRFGPINTSHGYRRLNVAVTRAKEKLTLVSSIRYSDIHPQENNRGATLLQRYLEYAEKGISVLDASKLIQPQDYVEVDSPFELEVEKALQDRGFIVHRQVGASGFKIDLAVVDPKNEATYVLGIECDGAAYHSSYSARMNDRIRQEILERLGWKLYRIWSQHWIMHREEIINDIVRQCR